MNIDNIEYCCNPYEDNPFPNKITAWIPDGISIIIPGNTGIVWHHQVGNVSCDQYYIEGSIIPIGVNSELLEKLVQINSERGTQSENSEIWQNIKKQSGIDFDIVAPPSNLPNTEGFWWVKFRKFPPDEHPFSIKNLSTIINKRVVLVYDNSD